MLTRSRTKSLVVNDCLTLSTPDLKLHRRRRRREERRKSETPKREKEENLSAPRGEEDRQERPDQKECSSRRSFSHLDNAGVEPNLLFHDRKEETSSATMASTLALSSSKIPSFTRETLQAAFEHLKAADPILAPVLISHKVPPESLLPKINDGSTFASLSKSICYQQLATKAAAKIFTRVLKVDASCAASGALTPRAVLDATLEDLRGAGLSERKAQYLRDLALHYEEGILSCSQIRMMDLEELHSALTAVKGIGPWTVDMFLIFDYGATDCLPTSDLGVRRGMQTLYKLKKLPTPSEMEAIAEKWRPWRSLGSYMMWKVLVN